jgi:hypothetical protein
MNAAQKDSYERCPKGLYECRPIIWMLPKATIWMPFSKHGMNAAQRDLYECRSRIIWMLPAIIWMLPKRDYMNAAQSDYMNVISVRRERPITGFQRDYMNAGIHIIPQKAKVAGIHNSCASGAVIYECCWPCIITLSISLTYVAIIWTPSSVPPGTDNHCAMTTWMLVFT